tara:strand:- start:3039 stop:3257 length:219 start_codon:yes stop_codon:yes gene_type:complete
MIKVEGNYDLVRDPKSGSLININDSGYETYLTQRAIKKKKSEKVSTMEEDLSNLKNEINEIKSLLKEIVNGK